MAKEHNNTIKTDNASLLTYICILVFSTSSGKQAVTDITDAKLLLRKRTFADICFDGACYIFAEVP
jgi:hypothetical protein